MPIDKPFIGLAGDPGNHIVVRFVGLGYYDDAQPGEHGGEPGVIIAGYKDEATRLAGYTPIAETKIMVEDNDRTDPKTGELLAIASNKIKAKDASKVETEIDKNIFRLGRTLVNS